MSPQKFHIGKNGPAPCNAEFRACKYEIEGTKAEVSAIWERQLEAEFADSALEGISRDAPREPSVTKDSDIDSKGISSAEITESLNESSNQSRMQARVTLSNKVNYIPNVDSDAEYSEDDQNVAMKLALSNLSEFSYIPIRSRDLDWETDGSSQVARYILEDGSVGYFKSFEDNSQAEDFFNDYGTTSLGAGINEVNSYRMAQAFGGEYANLVPETVIREIDGSIGTLQREVKEFDSKVSATFEDHPHLKADYRRAAIFDFVGGNLDRHDGNFLYGTEDDGKPRIRLIDNSFSFPLSSQVASVNSSIFADNDGPRGFYASQKDYRMPDDEMTLVEEDMNSLERVRTNISKWMKSKTINSALGQRALDRIDFLLKNEEISSFSENFYMDCNS